MTLIAVAVPASSSAEAGVVLQSFSAAAGEKPQQLVARVAAELSTLTAAAPEDVAAEAEAERAAAEAAAALEAENEAMRQTLREIELKR
eukprot:2651213-Prymnesium_polylepis.1